MFSAFDMFDICTCTPALPRSTRGLPELLSRI